MSNKFYYFNVTALVDKKDFHGKKYIYVGDKLLVRVSTGHPHIYTISEVNCKKVIGILMIHKDDVMEEDYE